MNVTTVTTGLDNYKPEYGNMIWNQYNQLPEPLQKYYMSFAVVRNEETETDNVYLCTKENDEYTWQTVPIVPAAKQSDNGKIVMVIDGQWQTLFLSDLIIDEE